MRKIHRKIICEASLEILHNDSYLYLHIYKLFVEVELGSMMRIYNTDFSIQKPDMLCRS